MHFLQRNANLLDNNVVEFFEAGSNNTVLHTANELILQKLRLKEELDEVQKNAISNMIDTVITNKHLKQAWSNVLDIIY
jgi:hypothetical protein